MVEAMAFGKPVIATGYSGNLEFMHAGNSHLVPYELTTIPAGCDPYPEGGKWADPDVEAAADLLRRVYDHPHEARQLGGRARTDIVRLHSPEARAQFLATRLETIERTWQSGVVARAARRPSRVKGWLRRHVGPIAFAVWGRIPEAGRRLVRPFLTRLLLRGGR
jgi:hypothetical protein